MARWFSPTLDGGSCRKRSPPPATYLRFDFRPFFLPPIARLSSLGIIFPPRLDFFMLLLSITADPPRCLVAVA